MKLWNRILSAFTGPVQPVNEPESLTGPAAPMPSAGKHARVDHEKGLITAFKTAHENLLEQLEDGVYNCNIRIKKAEDPATKAELCRKTIRSYEKLKTVCVNTGPGGAMYFEDMWEHCCNPSNPDFRFIDPVEKELLELENQGIK